MVKLRTCMQELQSISQQLAQSRRAAEEAHDRSSQVSVLPSPMAPTHSLLSTWAASPASQCSMLVQLAVLLRMVAMHASVFSLLLSACTRRAHRCVSGHCARIHAHMC